MAAKMKPPKGMMEMNESTMPMMKKPMKKPAKKMAKGKKK